jgi:hypothetical protein
MGECNARARSWADAATPAQPFHTHPAACLDHRDVADMPHRTTDTNQSKLWALPLTWIWSILTALTQRLFTASDTAARQDGWQAGSMHCGFGRRYRDPRFDTLASCPDCRGCSITPPGNSCQKCSGTGRIIVKRAAEPPSSPPPRGLA